MRRCPECYEIYQGTERYCELDGQPLLADLVLSSPEDTPPPDKPSSGTAQQSWLTGLLGLTVGILLCGAAYAVHALWTSGDDSKDQQPSYSARTRDVPVDRPAPPRKTESNLTEEQEEATDAEAEASPEPEPQPSTAPDTQSAAARLNQGPVSTGQRVKESEKKAQTIILMKDGTAVEVDAAWEDKQGVWYRRGGLVSFVESQAVKAITARAEPKVSSDESAP